MGGVCEKFCINFAWGVCEFCKIYTKFSHTTTCKILQKNVWNIPLPTVLENFKNRHHVKHKKLCHSYRLAHPVKIHISIYKKKVPKKSAKILHGEVCKITTKIRIPPMQNLYKIFRTPPNAKLLQNSHHILCNFISLDAEARQPG